MNIKKKTHSLLSSTTTELRLCSHNTDRSKLSDLTDSIAVSALSAAKALWHDAKSVGTLLAILAMAVAIGSVGVSLEAQTVTGTIYGTITDSSGAAIPGATITAVNVDTNGMITTRSSSKGGYVFAAVNPGLYRVKVTMAGFSTMTQTNLRVSANQNVNASFTMKPGEVTAQVTVEAIADLVDTRESQLAQTIDRQRIVDLPLTTRNAYDLVTLTPGITYYSSSAQIGDTTGTEFSTNGIRPTLNSFYLDGAYNTEFFRGGGNVLPPPDALAEFRIITSNFDAEFGRYPGAVVNAITRSGTNKFHGIAYDYLRNDALNATNYFQNSKAMLRYNIYGAGFGGPILRQALFFFANYQGLRINQQTIINQGSYTVPTTLERMGNFSASQTKPNLADCPNYVCPLDPVASAFITNFVPNGVGGTSIGPEQRAPDPVRENQGTARIDYQLNPAHHLEFTFFQSRGTSVNRTINGNALLNWTGLNVMANQSNYVIADNWIVSSHAVNTATAFYTLNHTSTTSMFPQHSLAGLGMTIPEGGAIHSQPQLNVIGYFKAGGSGVNNQPQLMTGFEDTFNYTHGLHTVKFGGSLIFNRYHEDGTFNSSTVGTFNGNAVVNGKPKTGNALADFELGHAFTFQQNSSTFHRLHAWDPSLFAQDDWHFARRFTANLGVRWEVYYPFSGQGNLGTFIPGVQSTRFPTAPIGLLSEGDPGVPPGVLNVSLTEFAPRIGFAWDIFGTGTTSLRGGYGLFYSSSQETFIANLEQQPFIFSATVNNTTNYTNPYAGQPAWPNGSPFPYVFNASNPTFSTSASISGLKPYTSAIPYVQEYNLTLEQQFGSNWVTRMSYVGNLGRRYYLARDQNSPIYSATATEANAVSRRPFNTPALGNYRSDINLLDPAGNSNYNSLQLSVTRNMDHGLSFQASYVWSKAMDDVSLDPAGPAAYTLANEYNVGMDYGRSTLDVPQRFVASALYQLPEVHRFGLFGKEALSGWQVNGIETLATGNPFNVLSNVDSNFDTIASTDRPDLIGNASLPGGRSKVDKIREFFNTTAFVAPPPGQPYGNSQRNPLIGPGTVETDISAFKRFAVYERANVLFRAEAFNLFNNTNLNNPNGTMGSPNFGVITGASDPRQLQLALKVEF